MVDGLGEMSKGIRGRIERGSRERIEKIKKFEEGLRDPPFFSFL